MHLITKLSLFFSTMISTGTVWAHGISEADRQAMIDGGNMEYINLGAMHMLTGYDHLLFIFAVIFFLKRFSDIVKFITAFTIGHSITLIFATLYTIQANYFLVDAVIALTVCYKAFDNLDGFQKYIKIQPPKLIWMVFIFGLIHGFGLSTRLQQLPLGDEGVVLRIISFNIGVEIGQIVALSIMLFLLSGWRHRASFIKFSAVTNSLIFFAGFMLLLMQLHGYSHSAYPDDFPMNKDDHYIDKIIAKQKSIAGEKLDVSWQAVPAANKRVIDKDQWSYTIAVQHHELNKTLYFLLSNRGILFDANFTGKFKK